MFVARDSRAAAMAKDEQQLLAILLLNDWSVNFLFTLSGSFIWSNLRYPAFAWEAQRLHVADYLCIQLEKCTSVPMGVPR